MRILFLFSVFLLVSGLAGANNIKVNGEARVVDFIGAGRDTAIVEFGVSWENSWRDDFNWDAAWIFLKYKKRGLTSEWHHAYLNGEGHEVLPQGGDTGSYTFMAGGLGQATDAKVTGVFIVREEISEGHVNVKLRLKWPLQSNARLPLTEQDFGGNRDSIFVAAYAVEMVYVPYGSYIAGDEYSNGAFEYTPSDIPAEENLIGRPAGYVYSASSVYSGYPPTNALPTAGSALWCSAAENTEDWWQVDFGTPKTIRYFAAGNAYGTVAYGYLEGSDTGNSGDWHILWSGGSNCWPRTSAYPIPQRIKVGDPKAYRYYRLRMKTGTWNGLYYVAMSEKKGDDHSYLFISNEEAQNKGGFVVPASYPKGYRGYYCMKYEVSQEQYVEFLNSLTLAQQKNRVANNDFEHMVRGDYVFGDLKRPNCRNGIAFIMTKGKDTPAVFGNNLNPGNKFYSEDDGQTLACNYLSPADMLAYCDWSGLRPMSELEYEKACRRPSPQIPDKGEYAWNSNNGVRRITSEGDLTNSCSERETPFDYRMNVNSGGQIKGPVRNGAFATSRTGQVEAGATYWGLMEMSGNVWEMCYSANAAGRSFVGDNAGYSHGDGYLNSDGTTDIGVAYWPSAVNAFALRGGSFAGADSLLRTSDRTYATGNYFSALTQRDSTVGFRGVRSILNTTGFTAGRIYCGNGGERDTVCSGEVFTIEGEPAGKTVGKTVYSWYISEDNGTSWTLLENMSGITLTYEGPRNLTDSYKVFQFKRKVICSVGEEMSDVVSVCVVPEVAEPELKNYELYAGFGYDLKLPASLDQSQRNKWVSPSGEIWEGREVWIRNFASTDNGVYKLSVIGQNGCESKVADVKVMGMINIPIIDYGDYKGWADGTYASSATAYLHPVAPYEYAGATGNGVYRLAPEGMASTTDAFCDMSSYGGGWIRIWVAKNNNQATASYSYEVGNLKDWNFSEVGMAYFNTLTGMNNNFVKMSGDQVIADFKTRHPFTYAYRDISVTATYNEKTQENVLFRYGYYSFHWYIYEAWVNDPYGRIGLSWSEETPYYNAFNSSAGDYCSLGHQSYGTSVCSETRRFSLWIR